MVILKDWPFNTDIQQLHLLSENVSGVVEAKDVLLELNLMIKKSPVPAVGLAAPQISIFKKAAIINVPGFNKLELINPIITKYSGNYFNFEEGCLSLPGIGVSTHRFSEIELTNYRVEEGVLVPETLTIYAGKNQSNTSRLYLAAIQHEVAHLYGHLMIDQDVRIKPVEYPSKPERNSRCPCNSGKKYKHCCGK